MKALGSKIKKLKKRLAQRCRIKNINYLILWSKVAVTHFYVNSHVLLQNKTSLFIYSNYMYYFSQVAKYLEVKSHQFQFKTLHKFINLILHLVIFTVNSTAPYSEALTNMHYFDSMLSL